MSSEREAGDCHLEDTMGKWPVYHRAPIQYSLWTVERKSQILRANCSTSAGNRTRNFLSVKHSASQNYDHILRFTQYAHKSHIIQIHGQFRHSYSTTCKNISKLINSFKVFEHTLKVEWCYISDIHISLIILKYKNCLKKYNNSQHHLESFSFSQNTCKMSQISNAKLLGLF